MKVPREYQITPLGAAIVEALPDQAKVWHIKREWHKYNRCPTSAIFPTRESVTAFWVNYFGPKWLKKTKGKETPCPT